jgi:F0F1-type ATP synthase assembly protein I
MGYELVLAIVVMGAIGYGLDWAIGRTKPWLLVAGLLLGIVAGLTRFMREARAAVRGSDRLPRPPGTGPS